MVPPGQSSSRDETHLGSRVNGPLDMFREGVVYHPKSQKFLKIDYLVPNFQNLIKRGR